MAKLIVAINMSLDGYVDHQKIGPPVPSLFRHWITHVQGLAGTIYGRRMYEVMRYWDDEQDDWGADAHDFAVAWRRLPKWVMSQTLGSVGPNATLIKDDAPALVRRLKNELQGELAIGGTELADSLNRLDLIDEYRLYIHPVALGTGSPFFKSSRPRMRLASSAVMGGDVMRLVYLPVSPPPE